MSRPEMPIYLAESEKLYTENRRLREELDEARSWAKHGYEIGQRSCTWSDQGVAPEWLTGSYRPSAEDARLDGFEGRLREIEHRLDGMRLTPEAFVRAWRDWERTAEGDSR